MIDKSELLSTARAADMLGVSEASVRRWSDAGLLPVQRIGRRRERRFRAADLRRFAEDALGAVGDGASPPKVSIGSRTSDSAALATPGGAQLAIHDHFPAFYDSDSGRLRLSLPFLRDGLLAGHRCFLAASPQVSDEYFQALSHEDGVDLEAAVASGGLVTLSSGPGSSAREAVAAWEQLWWQAVGLGASAIRVVGEMATYEGLSSIQEMLDYEVAYDSLAKRLPVMTLCQYDVRHFDGGTIMSALQVHPDLFSRRIADFLI